MVVIDTSMPPVTWRPGGFATAKLVLKETTSPVVLPRDKVLYEDNRAYCWLVETRDGQLVARRAFIETGASDETTLIITKGVTPGEQVIVEGLAGMSDGVKIVIMPDKKDDVKKDESKKDEPAKAVEPTK